MVPQPDVGRRAERIVDDGVPIGWKVAIDPRSAEVRVMNGRSRGRCWCGMTATDARAWPERWTIRECLAAVGDQDQRLRAPRAPAVTRLRRQKSRPRESRVLIA